MVPKIFFIQLKGRKFMQIKVQHDSVVHETCQMVQLNCLMPGPGFEGLYDLLEKERAFNK
jgi:hypothetical protein